MRWIVTLTTVVSADSEDEAQDKILDMIDAGEITAKDFDIQDVTEEDA